ncbi:MAG: cobalamin-dependent protein [Nitrospirae bacterium]|nr:cobalamin-dependent protein [Nitrospirota bacterium]MBF0533849.1 cobalamin-dependent protein [Nitrospirota bacterium]MBF0615442.1 cobalamin-dependent protein [Nitrospirota bacterium]
MGSVGGEQIPLGIYYIAAYLRTQGFVAAVTDAEALKLTEDDIIKEIRDFAPGFVGISSTTVAFHRALTTARLIKEKFPDVLIILGGPHVTSNYEHAMSFEAFDYGVVGEGEATVLELLNALYEGRPVADIKGIVYRDTNGKLLNTGRREYIQDLDTLPYPAFDLISDINLYKPPPSNYKTLPVVNMITSRGCPSGCTFCDKNIFGRMYRKRSAQNVFDEIMYLWEKYRIREIAFVDDTFLVNKQRIYDLFALIQKSGLFFHWTCMARINNVDFEFLKFLRDNGCWNIAFGIESGDEEILKVIKKDISLEKTRQVIGWCRTLKIKTKGFFIIGHPLETLETMNKTIEFSLSIPLDAVVVTINTPIPGSPQYAEAHKYGSLDTTDWSQFNYWRPVFVPAGLTKEILLEKQKEMYTRFYMRPHILFEYFKSLFGRGGIQRLKAILPSLSLLIQSKLHRI